MNLFYYTFIITFMQRFEKENLKILGDRIKSLRLKNNLSLNQFVFKYSEITTATWSRIENGVVDVKFNTLLKVCESLGIKIDELLADLDFNYISEDE